MVAPWVPCRQGPVVAPSMVVAMSVPYRRGPPPLMVTLPGLRLQGPMVAPPSAGAQVVAPLVPRWQGPVVAPPLVTALSVPCRQGPPPLMVTQPVLRRQGPMVAPPSVEALVAPPRRDPTGLQMPVPRQAPVTHRDLVTFVTILGDTSPSEDATVAASKRTWLAREFPSGKRQTSPSGHANVADWVPPPPSRGRAEPGRPRKLRQLTLRRR